MTGAGRTILITGCSSGIGLDAARNLRGRGWRVLATCRAEADCARLRDEGLESFALDYADPASVAKGAAEALARTGGRVDALFNNGAFALPGAVEDVPREGLRAIFETNLFGVHDLTCRLLPAMRKAGTGRVINCSSVLGLQGLKWRGAYVASKFALEGLTDVLRLEMRGTGIDVILIEPGPIRTEIRRKSRAAFERWIDWRASARAPLYEAQLIPRLYAETGKADVFELPPAAVTARLIRALEDRNPRPRYFVTTPTWIVEAARRLLPTRLRDPLLDRFS